MTRVPAAKPTNVKRMQENAVADRYRVWAAEGNRDDKKRKRCAVKTAADAAHHYEKQLTYRSRDVNNILSYAE